MNREECENEENIINADIIERALFYILVVITVLTLFLFDQERDIDFCGYRLSCCCFSSLFSKYAATSLNMTSSNIA